MKNKQKAVIIGAGIGGMSLGCLLAKEGFEVTILEKNSTYGGRGRILKVNGFTFDMGPSWYLLPEIFEQFFQLFGKKTSDYYELIELDPSYRIFLSEKRIIDIHRDLEKNLQTFAKLEKDGDIKFKKYLDKAEKIYNVLVGELFYQDLTSKKVLLQSVVSSKLRELNIADLLINYEKFTSRYFKSEEIKIIVQHGVALLGSHPEKTPALFAMMSHADYNLGVLYPKGGMGELFKAIYKLSKELGVTYAFDTEATKIEVSSRSARFVRTKNGELYPADVVISNGDYASTEMFLLDDDHRTYDKKYWESAQLAPSAFIVYLGIEKKIPQLLYHNLFLDRDWRDHFKSFYGKNSSWPEKPAFYLCCPSANDETVAPEGCENIFITVPIPAGVEDTDAIRNSYFEKLIKHIESVLGVEFRKHLVYKKIFTIKDFEKDFNSYKGTALGLANTLTQSSVLRVKHKSKKVNNLYYVGQYTHPGAGLSAAIASARIVSDKIKNES